MVRFACDRCGKRYAVKGEPVPGRKYRVTCKACGHVLLFTGAPPAPGPAGAAPAHAQATPASELLPQATGPDGVPEPRRDPDPFGPRPPEPPAPPTPALAAGPDFVDLFGDGGFDGAPPPSAAGGELPATATDDPPSSWATDAAPPPPSDDPPPWPSPSRTGKQLRNIALGGAAFWVVILAIAFGVWLSRRSHAPVQSSSAPGATAGAPAAPPAPALATDPAPEPPRPDAPPAPLAEATPEPAAPVSEPPPAPPPEPPPEVTAPPAPAPSPAKRSPPARVKPPARKPARPAQHAAVQPPPPAPNAAAAPEPAAPAPSELPAGLTDAEIQRVLGTARGAFQKCLRDPSRGLPEPLGARQVTLRFNVSPGGEVSYATIDDVAISSAPVGQCLKSAARALVFPAFRGDPLRVDAPVSIPGR